MVEGRVRISCRMDIAAKRLRILWAESGEPRVGAPVTTGYGTELIRSATAYTLGGELRQDYAPEGLKTEIAIPFSGTERVMSSAGYA